MNGQSSDIWRDAVADVPGLWSLRVIGDQVDLSDSASRVHPAASIIKVPILSTTLQLVSSGHLSLEERVKVPEPVGGAGALHYLDLESVTLRQALSLMITISDNVATNAVIRHLGMDAFQRAWLAEPYYGFELNRMLGKPASSPAEDNHATADAAARCLLQLQRRGEGGDEAALFGLKLLAAQQFRDRIPSHMPDDVECLNKTGELPYIRHDVALLRRDGKTLAIALMASGIPIPSATSGGGVAAEIMGRTAAEVVARYLT